MPTVCTVDDPGSVEAGDALCLVGWDTNHDPHRPMVGRATRVRLSTSKTVFGIAKTNANHMDPVDVFVAGEVVSTEVSTGLAVGAGPSTSRIVATDITRSDPNPDVEARLQCKLVRIERPNGSEHVVGTVEENGNLAVQPRGSIDTSGLHIYNVRAYGAIPDFDPRHPDKATDNIHAFEAALAAMRADNNKAAKLVAEGWFYLSKTLDIHSTVVFEGSGRSEPDSGGRRSGPGTWLLFPKGVTGIRIHSGQDERGGGDFTVLRNLTVFCNFQRESLAPEGQTGHGIWLNAVAYLDHVTVENFGEHGIFVDAGAAPEATVKGSNAGGFQFTKCIVSHCGGDGFRTLGTDANVGLISCCTATVNYGWGFFDESVGGNTYVACHGEGNKGYGDGIVNRDYKTPEGPNSNYSVFVSCYSEVAQNEVAYPSLILGGALSQNNVKGAFSIDHTGRISGQPLHYSNSQTIVERIEFGQPKGDHPGVLNFALSTGDYNLLRYDASSGWWTLDNSAPGNASIRIPTTVVRPRRTAPLFANGIFFGSARALGAGASAALINHIAGSDVPASGTWETGDVVWNSAPVPGNAVGWVCTSFGTQGNLGGAVFGEIDINDDPTLVTVTDATNLEQWQYIKIDGVSGVKQIVSDPAHPAIRSTIRIDSPADATVTRAAITWVAPTFSTFGSIENVGNSVAYGADQTLVVTNRYVTVTANATIRLPSSPVDGQIHEIKSRAGVTARIEGNANTIDGSSTATVNAETNVKFRYSAATLEWEAR